MTFNHALVAIVPFLDDLLEARIARKKVGISNIGGLVNKILFAIFAGVSAILLAACNGTESTSVEMAPFSELPPRVQEAPVTVQEAYRFALANPDLLQQIPCYCGCGGVGHTSNYACYVAGEQDDGSVAFDYHALG
jgi:hypothetical protein